MRPLAPLKTFRRDSRGVSAVEFALIAPVLITTFMGLAELSQGMTVQRRVSHAASAVGDLVAQADKMTDASLASTFQAATAIVTPFSTGPLLLRVTSITGDATGVPKVDWSKTPSGQSGLAGLATASTVPTCSSTVTTGCVPSGLITSAGENVILSESQYAYTALVKYVLKNGLTFREKFYLRPRRVSKVPYSAT